MAALPRPCRRIVIGLAMLVCLADVYAGTLRPDVEQAAQRNFAEYLELLRLRNVPDVPADIQRNADFLQRAFERRGFRARQVDNPAGRPVVLAELDATHRRLRRCCSTCTTTVSR